MAVPCPACSHLHFETNRAALPSHCTACGHDLSQPVARIAPPPVSTLSPGPTASRPFLFAGVAVLCAAGWFLLSGVAEREKYRPVTATMTVGYLEWTNTNTWAAGGGPTTSGNSYYVVDGQTYRTTIDRRWRVADQFELWHLPETPEAATEVRPFGKLFAAGFLMVVGLFLVGRGFGLFGSAVEPVDETITVPLPTEAEDAASPPA